jgi:predicted XRE-type DNA-binding protein
MNSRSSHISKGDVLDELGFSRSEASALKIKADILGVILAEIDRLGLTQRELVEVLDEYQPNVSNLLHGRISRVSIEKMLGYADRLRIQSSIELRPTVKRKAQIHNNTRAM